jgi:hypothetical protein
MAIAVGLILLLVLWVLIVYQMVDRRRISRIWRSLDKEGGGKVFSGRTIAGLPPIAQRYFSHAIQQGTPLAASVQFGISGSVKAQKDARSTWMSLKATQILAPLHGFVWKARIRKGLIRFREIDHYYEGSGRIAFRAFRIIPVLSAAGDDGAKSAVGRLVMDSVLLPAGLLPQQGVKWEASDAEHAKVTCTVENEDVTLTLRINAEGALRDVVMERWGDFTDDGKYSYVPFGMAVDEEKSFNGYTIPSKIRGGWWYGTEKYVESMRLSVEEARFK